MLEYLVHLGVYILLLALLGTKIEIHLQYPTILFGSKRPLSEIDIGNIKPNLENILTNNEY
jgi:hypothetical protein